VGTNDVVELDIGLGGRPDDFVESEFSSAAGWSWEQKKEEKKRKKKKKKGQGWSGPDEPL
jgi:hypothetical protein